MTQAFVVGSGPNGLAAAVTLALAGCDVTVIEAQSTIGGGARSTELTLPGLIHDHCAAIHPIALENPLLQSLTSDDNASLEWLWPAVQCAHPLIQTARGGAAPGSGGAAAASAGAALYRDVHATAQQFPTAHDRFWWERLFRPLSSNFAKLAPDILQPPLRLARRRARHTDQTVGRRWGNLLRFSVPAALPAVATSHLWQSPEARALFAGVAAHGFRPLTGPGSSAIGMMLTTAAHARGWPVAKGGSQAITDAFVHALQRSGGHVTTGSAIRSLDDLPAGANDIVMLDTTPQAALNIIAASRRPPQVPAHVRAALSRYRYGPGVAVVNFAIDGDIPWTYQPARRAGTVHLGGSVRDIHAAEREINRGRLPERPFVLVTQQYVADPSRSSEGLHPIDAYAHVPAGYTGNCSEQYEASALCASIERQIEQYAPGFRERIVAKKIRTPADVERDNANSVGGNITTGANTLGGLLGRPRLSTNPYTIAAHGDGPRVYSCSAATPPGAGAHGLCGLYAAQAALSR
ncbi:phytoene desaturase family protein [Corynebacterium sp. 23_3061]|uniref:phytoene desaturase family protein n=1 Tax=Corynebacterium kroppenstedtii TaxID=161879 RepID=UPI00195ED6BA|nr:NAD(P)/FAD-dependent oxidoreductase [Corynebacterium kroppenstedtii]QRQ65656.1 NAD(P)/FAD-dependent oxidoreductase [Corynebacterium kroppenstedtii]